MLNLKMCCNDCWDWDAPYQHTSFSASQLMNDCKDCWVSYCFIYEGFMYCFTHSSATLDCRLCRSIERGIADTTTLECQHCQSDAYCSTTVHTGICHGQAMFTISWVWVEHCKVQNCEYRTCKEHNEQVIVLIDQLSFPTTHPFVTLHDGKDKAASQTVEKSIGPEEI